ESSELDQYFLYAPVNLNSFNNFSEYTSLFERPFRQLTVTAGAGDSAHGEAAVRTQSGSARFAHTAFVDYAGQNGPRPHTPDYRVQGTAVMKFSFGAATNMFATLTGVKQDKGKDYDSVVGIGTFPYQVSLDQIVQHPDPTFTRRRTIADATVGLTHFWTPGAVLTLKSDALYNDAEDHDPDATLAACPDEVGAADLAPFSLQSDSRFALPYHGVTFEGQQTLRLKRHQLFAGGDFTWRRKTRRCHDFITSTLAPGSFTADAEQGATEQTAAAYLRDDVELTRWLHATIGARYVDGLYEDPFPAATAFRF